MIKKVIMATTFAAIIALYSGCANGPIRNLFKGAFCNSCQPPVGQPLGCGTNYAPNCDACGTGALEAAPMEAPVSQPFIESAPYAAPQDAYYSQPVVSDPILDQGYVAPMQSAPIESIPSSEVYGSGIGDVVSPPSIGPLQGSGTRN